MSSFKVQAIVPAAGSGTRFKSKTPKQFVSLLGKPLIVHTLKRLAQSRLIESIIIVAPAKDIKTFIKLIGQYRLSKIKTIVVGGKTRFESVTNGLKAVDSNTDIVLVHDGVRPLVTMKMIDESIKLCHNSAAVVAAVPVKPTIKRVHVKTMTVKETLPREELWEIQTPQTFKKAILVKAHKRAKDKNATDDASLVEAIGMKVKVILGDYKNIKITTLEDFKLAEQFLK
jgi:2-C-methyl-D-erythritol 4-phosphate cytidylyltransferase